MRHWRLAGLVVVFAWFMLGGVGHFALTEMFTSVAPPYVPYPREVVWATGICEIVGALALLSTRLRRVAGLALIVFAICVTPVHVEMLLHPERYPKLGEAVLWLRLLAQPVLIWIIWVVTKPLEPRPGLPSETAPT